MSEIVVNDVFDELREENQRLKNELLFEKDLNGILENIKNYAFILKNNCNCSENIEVFKKLNDFEIDYKILKSKEKALKNGDKQNVCEKLPENGFKCEINSNTLGMSLTIVDICC